MPAQRRLEGGGPAGWKPALRYDVAMRIAILVAAAVALFFVSPSEQYPDYGVFANDTPWLGVPRGRNVLSNAALLVAGAAGMVVVMRRRAGAAWLALFAGTFLTAFGSAYYHLAPTNDRLVWDRLPITLAMVGLIALMLDERVRPRLGTRLMPLLLPVAIASVFWWRHTGDLRPYAFFQTFAAGGTLLMLVLFPPRFTRNGYVVAAIAMYALAKIGEVADRSLYARTGIPGHPIKHVAAAAGAWLLLEWLRRRQLSGATSTAAASGLRSDVT